MTERVFERLDKLEDAVKKIGALMLAYFDADLDLDPSAEKALAKELREIMDRLG